LSFFASLQPDLSQPAPQHCSNLTPFLSPTTIISALDMPEFVLWTVKLGERVSIAPSPSNLEHT
jgi:hypothetical protein